MDNVKGNQIFKYSPAGELLLTLGKPGVRGNTPDLFNEPSDLTIAPIGDIYVADGHINQKSNFDRKRHITSKALSTPLITTRSICSAETT